MRWTVDKLPHWPPATGELRSLNMTHPHITSMYFISQLKTDLKGECHEILKIIWRSTRLNVYFLMSLWWFLNFLNCLITYFIWKENFILLLANPFLICRLFSIATWKLLQRLLTSQCGAIHIEGRWRAQTSSQKLLTKSHAAIKGTVSRDFLIRFFAKQLLLVPLEMF